MATIAVRIGHPLVGKQMIASRPNVKARLGFRGPEQGKT
jgi:hypothetical protein